MTYIIAEPCIDIKDRSCVDVCPVDCIHEAARILVIDPEECIDCGACEPECPVEAIFPEDALPEKWEPFVAVNYAFPRGFEAVDALVDAYALEQGRLLDHEVEAGRLGPLQPARVLVVREPDQRRVGEALGDVVRVDPADVRDHQVRRVDTLARGEPVLRTQSLEFLAEDEIHPDERDPRHA